MDQALLVELNKVNDKDGLNTYLKTNFKTIFPDVDDKSDMTIINIDDKKLTIWSQIIDKICYIIVIKLNMNFNDIDSTYILQIRRFLFVYLYKYAIDIMELKYVYFRNALLRLYRLDKDFLDNNSGNYNIKNNVSNEIIEYNYGDVKEKLNKLFRTEYNENTRYLYYDMIDFYKNIDKNYYNTQNDPICIDFEYVENDNEKDFKKQEQYDLISIGDSELILPDLTMKSYENKYKTVFTLSDIHGDIHAFIISLRDCAKVIEKNNYNECETDEYLEKMLKLDINDKDKLRIYDASLGYNWKKECIETCVVICGDMLDAVRDDTTKLHDFELANYNNIEVKLLLFINELTRQALQHKSRIFKILGNHEIINIQIMGDENKKYIHYTKTNEEYDNISRTKLFTFFKVEYDDGTEEIKNFYKGLHLLLDYNIYIALIINNNLFVHGNTIPIIYDDKSEYITYYDNINKGINTDYNKKKEDEITLFKIINENNNYNKTSYEYNFDNNKYINIFKINEINKDVLMPLEQKVQSIDAIKKEDVDKSDTEMGYMLWSRMFQKDKISERIKKNNDYCNELKKYLPENVERLIVGHCVQSPTTEIEIEQDYEYYTFTKMDSYDNVSNTFKEQIQKITNKAATTMETIAGITGECPTDNNNDFMIYHVDVGSSRAFDVPDVVPSSKDDLKVLYSRTPQILKIVSDDVSIIKSTPINTRIHQPRNRWEEVLKKEKGYKPLSEECKIVKSQPKPNQPKPDQPKGVLFPNLQTKSSELLTLINKLVPSDQSLTHYHQYLIDQHTKLNAKIQS